MAAPTPTTNPDTSVLDNFNLLSPAAIAGIALSLGLVLVLALVALLYCCHRRHRRRARSRFRHPLLVVAKSGSLNSRNINSRNSNSRNSNGSNTRRPRSSVSQGLDSDAAEAELGRERDPGLAVLGMDERDDRDVAAAAAGRGAGHGGGDMVPEEPPPAYSSLEYRRPPPPPSVPVPVPVLVPFAVEITAAETRTSSDFVDVTMMNPWMEDSAAAAVAYEGAHEEVDEVEAAPVAVPVTTGSRNVMGRSLIVNTNVTPVIHVMDENGDEDEEAGWSLSRSITYSASSVREAAFGTVAMPSIINRGVGGSGSEEIMTLKGDGDERGKQEV